MQLDVESLRTFLAVVDHGGMTRAAEHLDLSQSAVSWKIKRLEARVGKPLLLRDGHSIRPSRDGHALLDDARQMVQIHDNAVCRLQCSDLTGHVKIGANEEVDAGQMASVLGRFKQLHPGATIEFVVAHTEQLVSQVSAGGLDVAVVQVDAEHLLESDELLWTDQLCWATSRECLFADGTVPLITFGDHCFYRPLSEPLLTAAGIDHVAAFAVSSTVGVRAAIEAGLGVGVLSSKYLGGDVVDWPRAAGLGALPEVHQIARIAPGPQSPIVEALLASVLDELRASPAPVALASA